MYTVFSKPACTFCTQAKNLLLLKGLDFKEVHLITGQQQEQGSEYITREDLLAKVPTAKSMPQIFLDSVLIGGFKELKESLDAAQ